MARARGYIQRKESKGIFSFVELHENKQTEPKIALAKDLLTCLDLYCKRFKRTIDYENLEGLQYFSNGRLMFNNYNKDLSIAHLESVKDNEYYLTIPTTDGLDANYALGKPKLETFRPFDFTYK